MTQYFGVIGNRDHIKFKGEKRPFWEFLDRQPDGWLISLAYWRLDVPIGLPRIWDCGAWSYKNECVPKLGKNIVSAEWAMERYSEMAIKGDFIVAPDHILFGNNIKERIIFNEKTANRFFDLANKTEFRPMAVIHGLNILEKINRAKNVIEKGYDAIALGGLARLASAKKKAIEDVARIRMEMPGIWIHVLGLSAPSFAKEWVRLGIDSFDGASHFKQAFIAGKYYVVDKDKLTFFQASREKEPVSAPICFCKACRLLREDKIDTRRYGSNESNMGRAAHNLNQLLKVFAWIL